MGELTSCGIQHVVFVSDLKQASHMPGQLSWKNSQAAKSKHGFLVSDVYVAGRGNRHGRTHTLWDSTVGFSLATCSRPAASRDNRHWRTHSLWNSITGFSLATCSGPGTGRGNRNGRTHRLLDKLVIVCQCNSHGVASPRAHKTYNFCAKSCAVFPSSFRAPLSTPKVLISS